MIQQPFTQSEFALTRLLAALKLTNSPNECDRHEGRAAVGLMVHGCIGQIESLRQYHPGGSVEILPSGVVMLRIELKRGVVPGSFSFQPRLEAIGRLIYLSLGIQQWSLIGCDGKGLSVQHYNGQWIVEALTP